MPRGDPSAGACARRDVRLRVRAHQEGHHEPSWVLLRLRLRVESAVSACALRGQGPAMPRLSASRSRAPPRGAVRPTRIPSSAAAAPGGKRLSAAQPYEPRCAARSRAFRAVSRQSCVRHGESRGGRRRRRDEGEGAPPRARRAPPSARRGSQPILGFLTLFAAGGRRQRVRRPVGRRHAVRSEHGHYLSRCEEKPSLGGRGSGTRPSSLGRLPRAALLRALCAAVARHRACPRSPRAFSARRVLRSGRYARFAFGGTAAPLPKPRRSAPPRRPGVAAALGLPVSARWRCFRPAGACGRAAMRTLHTTACRHRCLRRVARC